MQPWEEVVLYHIAFFFKPLYSIAFRCNLLDSRASLGKPQPAGAAVPDFFPSVAFSVVIHVWTVEYSLSSSRVSASTVEVLGNKFGKAVSVWVCPPPPDITDVQAGLTGNSNPGA